MILTILGAPGAGKGTMAKTIAEKLNIPTISTGALLRDEIKSGSVLGEEINSLISNGNFVPDEMITPILVRRIASDDCKNGYILDGFPRNRTQAENLMNIGIKLDTALLIEVSDKDILTRLIGRRECPGCRTTFHVTYSPPKIADICDNCGTELKVRQDDKEDIILKRLKIYHSETEPLIQYFIENNLLVSARGETEISDTKENVFKALKIEW